MFPEIKFTCSGSITKWIVGAGTGGGSTPPSELQIWRRSGSDYNKMGSTQLTAQSPTNDDPNVYEYTLSMPLEFQEGDFLGVYQRDGSSIVPYYQENTGPQNFRQSGQANSAPNSLTSPPLAAEYDYPLVSVEIAGSLSTSLPQKVPSSTMQQDEQEATPTVSTFTGMMTSLQPSAVSNAASQASTTPSIQTVQDNTILYIAVALIVGAILIVAVTIIAVVMGIFIWKRRNSKKAQNSHNSYLTTSFNKDEQEHIVIASHVSQDSGPAMKLQQNECYDTVLNLKTNEPIEPMYEDLDSVVPKPKPDQDNSDLYYI